MKTANQTCCLCAERENLDPAWSAQPLQPGPCRIKEKTTSCFIFFSKRCNPQAPWALTLPSPCNPPPNPKKKKNPTFTFSLSFNSFLATELTANSTETHVKVDWWIWTPALVVSRNKDSLRFIYFFFLFTVYVFIKGTINHALN